MRSPGTQEDSPPELISLHTLITHYRRAALLDLGGVPGSTRDSFTSRRSALNPEPVRHAHCRPLPELQGPLSSQREIRGKARTVPQVQGPIRFPPLQRKYKSTLRTPSLSGGKTSTGEVSLKPIARKETRLPLIPTVIAVCGVLTVLAIAGVAGKVFQDIVALRGIALYLVSVPITIAGYAFLSTTSSNRIGENGCGAPRPVGLGFTALWVAYWFIPVDLRTTGWSWFFIAPVLLSIGGGIAWACYDLDFGNGFMLCCFYAALTIVLGWLAGLEMPWSVIRSRAQRLSQWAKVGAMVRRGARSRTLRR